MIVAGVHEPDVVLKRRLSGVLVSFRSIHVPCAALAPRLIGELPSHDARLVFVAADEC